MQHRRVRSLELQLDGILLEHQVILLHLDISIGIMGGEVLLDILDILVQLLSRREIDDEFAV